jgi:hypothetical protein
VSAFILDIALMAAGRGDDPSTLGGVLIVAGIVVAAAVLGFAGHFLIHRFGRTRPDVARRRPQRPGRVGRVWEFRERR